MKLRWNAIFQNGVFGRGEEICVSSSPKVADKMMEIVMKAEVKHNPMLFKKLNNDIWEFRMRHGFTQIRLLAFGDKTNHENIMVLATHGFLKKTDKVPGKEIERAINIRARYFDSKKE